MTATSRNDSDLDRPPGEDPTDSIVVREITAADLDAIARIDRHASGRDRRQYFEQRLSSALKDTGVRVSLAAEVDGSVTGFVVGRVYYGEYGRCEPIATIDTMGVAPHFQRQGVAHALMRQLGQNLRGLRVERIQTVVEWDQWDLLEFLAQEGFRPAPRLCLELALPPS